MRRAGDRTSHVQVRRCAITISEAGTDTGITPSGGDLEGTPTAAAPTTGATVRKTALGVPPDIGLGAGRVAVAVSLRVSVAHDLAIADASNQLRAAVIEAFDQEVGMDVSAVDIAVEDVHDA